MTLSSLARNAVTVAHILTDTLVGLEVNAAFYDHLTHFY